MDQALLQVKGLCKYFPVRDQTKLWGGHQHLKAVDDVSFVLDAGNTLGIVGESGCGKSTVGKTLLQLLRPTAGQVLFDGQDLTQLSTGQLRAMRREMQMVFQDPMESLNARHNIESILEEPLLIHKYGAYPARQQRINELLDKVGLAQAARKKFPHEFSGGQRQRIGIARAIALKPKLLICDEPVSALDVSVHSPIFHLLLDLQQEMNLAMLFIAHDLAVVKHVSDQVAVMYLGKIVEHAPAQALYQQPRHPYSQALLSAIPVPDPLAQRQKIILQGDVPSPVNPPSGCNFRTRCPVAMEDCMAKTPPLLAADPSSPREVACFHPVS
ncbi:MAG: ABC transporter ATP-binding protein [Pseudomonadales bacterium]